MTVSTYGGLVEATTEWLARDGDTVLIARIPDFITLAEAKFNRDLRINLLEKRATASVDLTSNEPEYVALPTYFQTMRRVRLSSATNKPRLNFKSATEADDFSTQNGTTTGQPRFFTIIGDEMQLLSTPDAAYTLEMVYRSYVAAVTTSNPTSTLLTLAPDLYLYGTLLEAAPYLKDDERIQIWTAGMQYAIAGLNKLSQDQTHPGPLQVRNSGYAP